MSEKLKLNPPRDHVSDSFFQSVIREVFGGGEEEIRKALDKTGLTPSQYFGGFRQFSKVPKAKLIAVTSDLWKKPLAQVALMNVWEELNGKLRDHVLQYLTTLGYIVPPLAPKDRNVYFTRPEHVVPGTDGKNQIVADARWPFLSPDQITFMAMSLRLMPSMDSVPSKELNSGALHVPSLLDWLDELSEGTKEDYLLNSDENWPAGCLPPRSLMRRLETIFETAGKLWDAINTSAEEDVAPVPHTIDSFRDAWNKRVEGACIILDGAQEEYAPAKSLSLLDILTNIDTDSGGIRVLRESLSTKTEFVDEIAEIKGYVEGLVTDGVVPSYESFVVRLAGPMELVGLDFKSVRLLHSALVSVIDPAFDRDSSSESQEIVSTDPTSVHKEEPSEGDEGALNAVDDNSELDAIRDFPTNKQAQTETLTANPRNERTPGVSSDEGVVPPLRHSLQSLVSTPNEHSRWIRKAIWGLCDRSDLALAYHLAIAAEQHFQRPDSFAWILHSVLLSQTVGVGNSIGRVGEALQKEVLRWTAEMHASLKTDPDRQAIGLLASSAYSYAALVRPEADLVSVLADVGGHVGNDGWYDFVRSVQDARGKSPHVNIGQLKLSSAGNSANEEIEKKIEEWWLRCQQKSFKYSGATELWRRLMAPEEPIGRLGQSLKDRDSKTVRAVVDELSNKKDLRKYVQTLNRKTRGMKEVTGGPLQKLLEEFEKSVALGLEYVELADTQSQKSDAHELEKAKEMNEKLRPVIDNALVVLDSLASRPTRTPLQISAAQSRIFIELMSDVLDPEKPLESTASALVSGSDIPLLRIPSVKVIMSDYDEAPKIIAPDYTSLVESLIEWPEDSLDDSQIVDQLAEMGNYDSARLYYQSRRKLRQEHQLDQSVEKRLRERRQQYLSNLQKRSDKLASDLERMVVVGAIDAEERPRLLTEIEMARAELEVSNNFRSVAIRLDSSERQINAAIEQAKSTLLKNLEELHDDGKVGDQDLNMIRAELNAGDLMLANERIGLLEKGLTIRPRVKIDYFEQFYKQFLRDIDDGWKGTTNLIRIIRENKTFRGLQYPQFSEEQRRRAQALLEAWERAARAKDGATKEFSKLIESILRNIGFSEVRLEAKRSSQGKRFLLQCRRIEGREQCPVPVYGSEAGGRYQILCLWERPSESEIVNAVGDTTPDSPMIVLHFGRLNQYRRASLSELGRERRRRFIVVDDFLVAFLSGQEELYLAVMFQATLPCAFLEPFVTAASTVPAEMFFGREAEIESVMNVTGSSFIFGGRQLGKTALLKEVRRRFHQPDNGRVAVFVDLERDIVNKGRVYEDFWNLIRKRLTDCEVIKELPGNARPDTIVEHVMKWLDNDNGRRILLLIDEADRFLEQDSRLGETKLELAGEAFAETRRLQKVMNDTNKRFKVVFAGLHQVQRVTKDVNQPLAHLGQPLQIGPLNRNNRDLQDALDLVREPLRAVGYNLSEESALKILTEANYYPSLIQLYGQSLVGSLNRSNIWRNPQKNRPRYEVQKEQVERFRSDQDLQAQIRDRFRWTLQLDPRYEFVANVMAWEILEDREFLVRGFSAAQLLRSVNEWWPAGFEGMSIHEMSVLLSEMEGLGVLRSIMETGAYSLRNQSLLTLIGSHSEVEAHLTAEHDKPLEYTPSRYRREYSIDDEPSLAPLSDGEISALLSDTPSVTVVTGSPLSEFPGLSGFVQRLHDFVDRFEEPTLMVGNHSPAEFAEALRSTIQTKRSSEQLLLVVPVSEPWTLIWVDRATEIIGRYRQQRTGWPLHLLFLADHNQLWTLIDDSAGGVIESLGNRKAQLWSKHKWDVYELKQLKNALRRGWAESDIEAILQQSDGWPVVVQRLLTDINAEDGVALDDAMTTKYEAVLKDMSLATNVFSGIRQIPGALRVFQYGDGVLKDELADLLEWHDSRQGSIDQLLEWASLLALLSISVNGTVKVDPTIAALAQTVAEDDQS